MATLTPGSQLGEYRIEREIARGGMGIVYQATRVRTGQSIALKVIAAERAADKDYRARFVREAQVLVGLQHPRIVPLIDWGEVDGTLYLALGYLDGPNLEELLERSGPFSLSRTIELLAPVAEGLDSAHRRGYIHRDVKPANVMLDGEGNVYLTDFGLGKLAGSSGLSMTNTAIGTLAYMAPEQFTGKIDKDLASRVDVYALACVFHACLTRQEVVPTDSYARAMHAAVYEPPPRLSALRPSLPAELDDVEGRALAKDPAERYPTAGAFIAAARAILVAHPEPAPGVVPIPPPPTPQAGRQQIAAVADLAAFDAVAPVVAAGHGGGPPGATELAPAPAPATELVGHAGRATEVAPPEVLAGVGVATPPGPPARGSASARPRSSWVAGGAVAAGVLALAFAAGNLVFGGRADPSPTPQVAARTATPSPRATPTLRPFSPSPSPSPAPTPTATPTPTSDLAGAEEDPDAVAGTWPLQASTARAWVPPLMSNCAWDKRADWGEAYERYCATNDLDGYRGHDISITYLFFKTEQEVREAYEDQAQGYNTGSSCAAGDLEVQWRLDRDPDNAWRGRKLCRNVGGYAEMLLTFYGKPVLAILYRKGDHLDMLETAWEKNASGLIPRTGDARPR